MANGSWWHEVSLVGLNILFTFWLITNLAFFSFCLVQYGLRRLRKLQQLGFHAIMFPTLILCAGCLLLASLLQLVAANEFQIGGIPPEERSKDFWESIKLIESLFTIAWVLNMWVHLFFVMRYWVVTQKIK